MAPLAFAILCFFYEQFSKVTILRFLPHCSRTGLPKPPVFGINNPIWGRDDAGGNVLNGIPMLEIGLF
jgi:hypothetical protein